MHDARAQSHRFQDATDAVKDGQLAPAGRAEVQAAHLEGCLQIAQMCASCDVLPNMQTHWRTLCTPFCSHRAIIIEQLLRCQGYLSGVQEEVGQARERAAAGGEHVCRDAQLVEADFHSAQLDASPDGRVHGNEIQWPAYCNLTLSLLL